MDPATIAAIASTVGKIGGGLAKGAAGDKEKKLSDIMQLLGGLKQYESILPQIELGKTEIGKQY